MNLEKLRECRGTPIFQCSWYFWMYAEPRLVSAIWRFCLQRRGSLSQFSKLASWWEKQRRKDSCWRYHFWPSGACARCQFLFGPSYWWIIDFRDGIWLDCPNTRPRFCHLAVLCVTCDIPASRKLCGFLSFSATMGCNKCKKKFPRKKEANVE